MQNTGSKHNISKHG